MSGRGVCRGGRERIGIGRWCGVQRKFNIINNLNKSQQLKLYPHGTGPYQQIDMFNKVKYHLTLNIQIGFLNGSDIAELFCKGIILYLRK